MSIILFFFYKSGHAACIIISIEIVILLNKCVIYMFPPSLSLSRGCTAFWFNLLSNLLSLLANPRCNLHRFRV